MRREAKHPSLRKIGVSLGRGAAGFIGRMSSGSPRIGGANSGLAVEGVESRHNDTTAPRLPRLRLAMTDGEQGNSPVTRVFAGQGIDRIYVAEVRLAQARKGGCCAPGGSLTTEYHHSQYRVSSSLSKKRNRTRQRR